MNLQPINSTIYNSVLPRTLLMILLIDILPGICRHTQNLPLNPTAKATDSSSASNTDKKLKNLFNK